MHLAIEGEHYDILTLLLKYPKFDPRVSNRRDFNTLQFAALRGHIRWEIHENSKTLMTFYRLKIAIATNNHTYQLFFTDSVSQRFLFNMEMILSS